MKPSIIIGLSGLLFSTAAFAVDAPPAGEAKGWHGKSRMERLFKEIDGNEDGVISKDENAAFATKKFETNDANHDGKVTKEEWDAAREKKHKEWEARHADQAKEAVKKPTDKK